jgi:WD40 repeat protein
MAAWGLLATNRRLAAAERDAQEKLLASLLAQARGNQTSGRIGQRFESLEALRQAAVVARALHKPEQDILALRNQAIACLALPDIRVLHEWEGNPPGTNGLAFGARFTRYAWSSAAEGIRVRQLKDDKELFHLPLLPATRPDPWLHLDFSPSAKFLTVFYYERTPHRPLQVWELKPGVSRPWMQIEDVSGDPAFSADERSLAVALPGGAIALFDLSSRRRTELPSGVVPGTLAFSPDGRRLAVASTRQPVVEVRELPSGKVLRRLEHEAGVQAVAWNPQTSSEEGVLPLLATGCQDNRIYLWGNREGEPPRHLEGHGWEVPQLTFDATGTRLLSFGWDMTLRLWDVPARRLVLTLPDVRILGFCSEGGLQAASLQGKQVRILDLVAGGAHQVLHGHRGKLNQFSFHPAHDWLAAAGWGGTLRLWDVHSGRELARLRHPHGGYVAAMLWETSGQGLLTGSSELWRWPVQVRPGPDSRHARIGPPAHLLRFADVICEMDWCGPGNRSLAVCFHKVGSGFRLFRLDGRTEEVMHPSREKVSFISASPDGHWLATGTHEEALGVRVWDARSGKPEKAWDWGDAHVAFSPDGQWLMATTGRLSPHGSACSSWRVAGWKEGKRVSLNRPTSASAELSFSPDSRVLAVTSTITDIRLLRPDTFEEIATLTAPDTQLIGRLAFSHDGSRLAAAAHKTIHVWDLRAVRQRLRELGLDWHGPDYPARPPKPPRWTVEVDPGPAGP